MAKPTRLRRSQPGSVKPGGSTTGSTGPKERNAPAAQQAQVRAVPPLPEGVVWEFEDKIIDGKLFRVAARPSNDSCSATQYYWPLLKTEAHQVIAASQSRTWSVESVRRNFSTISYCAMDAEIEQLLEACSREDDEPHRRFAVGGWIGRVLNARTGIPVRVLERYHRFAGTRQRKRPARSSR